MNMVISSVETVQENRSTKIKTHVSVPGQERTADRVSAIHRPHALCRLDVPQLKRAMTRRSNELVVGRHGETAHIGAVPRQVERQEFDRFDGRRFGRSRRRQIIHF